MTDERKRKVWTAFMKEFSARFKEQMAKEHINVTIRDRGFSKSGVSLSFIDYAPVDKEKVEKVHAKLHGEIFRHYVDEYKEIFER